MSRPVRPTLSWFLPALIVAATVAVYARTFSSPFVFDDIAAITQNPSIHGFCSAFFPPEALSVTGRPLANLSLALSHALSGEAPWGYHALNLSIHGAAALALFGVVRRTLLLPRLRPQFGDHAPVLAFFVALLWSLHPLQTASVTYLMQRTESLMALCYLTTLYAFIRQREVPPPSDSASPAAGTGHRWQIVALTACLLGMACKEVMVSAPLIVLLYDRSFISGNFADAWRRSRGLYAGLAATWLLLGGLLLGTEGRGASAGFATEVSPLSYALTQLSAIARYLRLAAWPRPLVFDYGDSLVHTFGEVWLSALVVSALAIATGLAFRRKPALGFLGAFFFIVLAPTSSVVPVATQTIAEHRMYLPLAAVIVALVLGLHRWLERSAFALFALAAIALAGATVARNTDYSSVRSLWADTVAKRPGNPRAHYNLGVALALAGDNPGAIAEFAAAVRLQPNHVQALTKWGEALLESGNTAEAHTRFSAALSAQANDAPAHAGLARALVALGRLPEALPHFEAAARLDASSGISYLNLGNALLAAGRPADALVQLEHAQMLLPTSAETFFLQGNALVELHRLPEAVTHYQTALRFEPDRAAAHYNLGNALAGTGRYEEALTHFEAAIKLAPDDVSARNNRDRLRAYLKK